MSPLIRPERLAPLFADPHPGPRPVLLDVRWRLGGPSAITDYRAGHLPGAVFLELDRVLADSPGPAGRHPLPDPRRLADELAVAGVSNTSTVVSYDDADGSIAARAWWLLRWLGLPAEQVMVLDGGYAGWVRAGHPVDTEQPGPVRGELVARPGSMPVLDADGAAATALDGVLLDARAPARYRGETEPVDPRAGHVPGARNAPFAEHVGPDGRWRTPVELAGRFAGFGITEDARVGAYCGSGVTACSVLLAMEHSGVRPPDRPAALYTGSWSNWSADPARPAATGAEPDGATAARLDP